MSNCLIIKLSVDNFLQTKNKRHGVYVIPTIGTSNLKSRFMTHPAINGKRMHDTPYITDEPIIARPLWLLL